MFEQSNAPPRPCQNNIHECTGIVLTFRDAVQTFVVLYPLFVYTRPDERSGHVCGKN